MVSSRCFHFTFSLQILKNIQRNCSIFRIITWGSNLNYNPIFKKQWLYHITEKLKCIWFLALTLWLHLITASILSSTPTAICGAPLHTLSLTLGGPVSLNANYTQFSCRVLLVCRHCRHAIAATLNCINK